MEMRGRVAVRRVVAAANLAAAEALTQMDPGAVELQTFLAADDALRSSATSTWSRCGQTGGLVTPHHDTPASSGRSQEPLRTWGVRPLLRRDSPAQRRSRLGHVSTFRDVPDRRAPAGGCGAAAG